MTKKLLGKTDEEVEDIVSALLSAGSNATLTYDDANDTLTVSASGGATSGELALIYTNSP